MYYSDHMRILIGALIASAALQTTPAAKPVAIKANARALQPGELVVLTVTTSAPASAVRAEAFSRTLASFRVDDRAWQVLVGVDLTTGPAPYKVNVTASLPAGDSAASYTLKIADKAFPTRKLTVDDAFVTPPAGAMARIEEDARALERCWANPSPEKLWAGAFVRPVPHDANSAFGSRSVFNGQVRNPHSGADFRSPPGTPIKAPNAGRVVLARDLYYSGGTVVIDHGLGLFSLFAHLSKIDARDGATVATGDVVGLVGATGRVTGPHLHWMVRLNGARIDPLSLLQLLGATQPQ
jgi:murein DD-endopeptidase MepM/ murein hydrolase activator NlpD